jgi:hypothetical protein
MKIKMKFVGLAILAIFSLQSVVAQQISLKGEIFVHNSKETTGNLVRVDFAHVKAPSALPTTSGADGNFELLVVKVKRGAPIPVTVAKPGLEVVNWTDLNQVTLGRISKLRVFMAPVGAIAKARQELYNVSLAAITRTHGQ